MRKAHVFFVIAISFALICAPAFAKQHKGLPRALKGVSVKSQLDLASAKLKTLESSIKTIKRSKEITQKNIEEQLKALEDMGEAFEKAAAAAEAKGPKAAEFRKFQQVGKRIASSFNKLRSEIRTIGDKMKIGGIMPSRDLLQTMPSADKAKFLKFIKPKASKALNRKFKDFNKIMPGADKIMPGSSLDPPFDDDGPLASVRSTFFFAVDKVLGGFACTAEAGCRCSWCSDCWDDMCDCRGNCSGWWYRRLRCKWMCWWDYFRCRIN